MKKVLQLLRLVFPLVIMLCAALVHAQTWSDLKQTCGDAVEHPNRFRIEDCGRVYLAMPVRPVIKTIAPGGGFGGGLRAIHDFTPKARWNKEISGTAAVSTNRFLFLEGDILFERPAFACTGKSECPVKDNFQIELYTRRVELPGLAYYGHGNATTQQTHVQFGERWFEGGVKVLDPVLSWLDIGGEVGYVVPHIGPIPNSSIPSIESLFNDTQAPGLTEQPGFMHYKILALPHYPAILPFKLDYQIGYEYYQDLDVHRFSFHKFEADLINMRPLRWRRKAVPASPNAARDWFCTPQGAGKVCTLGYIAINGLLTLETAAQQQIPFYFQPTIGGADLADRDTLRGFLDLRFRAPDRMVLQGEYGHNIWGPLGILVFYETGRVGNRASDLGFSGLHHDVGVGVTLSVQNRILMRAYIGFGTGEGSRMNWKAGPLL
ncbi:MAG: hypothetical protein DMG38_15845 [Acidobacteria bacterium]|nr:MAG: hypothetical protein DMG38_15845 [Acidobacteriota bacterium]